MDEQDKADVFASNFRERWVLLVAVFVHPPFQVSDDSGYFVLVRPTPIQKVLKVIDPDKWHWAR